MASSEMGIFGLGLAVATSYYFYSRAANNTAVKQKQDIDTGSRGESATSPPKNASLKESKGEETLMGKETRTFDIHAVGVAVSSTITKTLLLTPTGPTTSFDFPSNRTEVSEALEVEAATIALDLERAYATTNDITIATRSVAGLPLAELTVPRPACTAQAETIEDVVREVTIGHAAAKLELLEETIEVEDNKSYPNEDVVVEITKTRVDVIPSLDLEDLNDRQDTAELELPGEEERVEANIYRSDEAVHHLPDTDEPYSIEAPEIRELMTAFLRSPFENLEAQDTSLNVNERVNETSSQQKGPPEASAREELATKGTLALEDIKGVVLVGDMDINPVDTIQDATNRAPRFTGVNGSSGWGQEPAVSIDSKITDIAGVIQDSAQSATALHESEENATTTGHMLTDAAIDAKAFTKSKTAYSAESITEKTSSATPVVGGVAFPVKEAVQSIAVPAVNEVKGRAMSAVSNFGDTTVDGQDSAQIIVNSAINDAKNRALSASSSVEEVVVKLNTVPFVYVADGFDKSIINPRNLPSRSITPVHVCCLQNTDSTDAQLPIDFRDIEQLIRGAGFKQTAKTEFFDKEVKQYTNMSSRSQDSVTHKVVLPNDARHTSTLPIHMPQDDNWLHSELNARNLQSSTEAKESALTQMQLPDLQHQQIKDDGVMLMAMRSERDSSTCDFGSSIINPKNMP